MQGFILTHYYGIAIPARNGPSGIEYAGSAGRGIDKGNLVKTERVGSKRCGRQREYLERTLNRSLATEIGGNLLAVGILTGLI
jgi:hypothetical protein